jgi:hypothetical protein
MGDGEAVDCAGAAVGAGMTVTTGFGEAVRRWRVGLGDGCGGLGLGLGADVRLGLGRGGGGRTDDGELDACAAVVCAGLGVLVAFGVLVAAGLAVGFGVGDGVAACADPSRTAGVSTMAASDSSTGRRTSDTRRL